MYLGSVVETGDTENVFQRPAHPYAAALIASVPAADRGNTAHRRRVPLQGEAPSPTNPPPGCRFHSRCPKVRPLCRQDRPALRTLPHGHTAARHFPLSA